VHGVLRCPLAQRAARGSGSLSGVEVGKRGTVGGSVVVWHDDEGWGVIASPAVDGEVWTHFSNIVGTGYRSLRRGQAVRLRYETPGQDGYPHRAVSVEAL
jgi:cold shock protein